MIKLYKTLAKFTIFLFSIVCSRTVLADQVVTNTNDVGPGSLAAAINLCNTTPGAETITFALPGPSFTINLLTNLPAITEALVINGYSQTGSVQGSIAARVIVINIDGTALPGGTDIFTVNSDNVTIAGLAIYKSPRHGINILYPINNVRIWGNYIGTNSTGTATGLGNANIGIASGKDNFGSVINTGIIVGTDGDGTNDANEGNLVSGSVSAAEGDGIMLWRSQNSKVSGNIIGLDKNGSGATFGNARNGILLTVSAVNNVIGTNRDGVSDALEANLIARSGGRGLLVIQSGNNVIAGNTIGLDGSGSAAGNAQQGIHIMNSTGTQIGTDGVGVVNNDEANIICFNLGAGILLSTEPFFGFEDNTNNTIIAGNAIGTDMAGTLVGGNAGGGVVLTAANGGFTVSNNIIGSNNDGTGDAAEANQIANNNNGGIVANPPATAGTVLGNKFSRNKIFNNNNLLGIDLSANNVTANDDGDGDVGPNDLFNFPVITSVQVNAGNLIVRGFSRPNSVIEFYIADAGPNPDPLPGGYTKDFGEGATYLFRGQDDGTLDAPDALVGTSATYTGAQEGTGTGAPRTEAEFSFTIPLTSLPSLPVPITAGTRITALAYSTASGAGNTSEFGGVLATVTTPVTLVSFNARLNNSKVYLTWKTTDEVNNSHFEIEKSTNGSAYAKIGSVTGKGGTNNTYEFTDNDVTAAVNYYRLKQVDIDGRPTLSKILVVRGDLGTLAAKVSPNPFTSAMNLSYKLDKAETIQVRLINMGGNVVSTYRLKGNAGVNTVNISDLGYLPAGHYTLELTGDKVAFRQQVVKQ